MKNSLLLTIAIPTFNRATYLDILLTSIFSQLDGFSDTIEVIICDNHSTDNTKEICNNHISARNNVRYIRNSENIGMDGNFEKCFHLAEGKYFWMIGDDDQLRPNTLAIVNSVLNRTNSYDLVYLNSNDKIGNDIDTTISYDEYTDDYEFIKRVGIMFTFISGIICNKQRYQEIDERERIPFTHGTYLLHLYWQLALVKNGNRFAVLNNNLMKSTSDNSGGYGLFTVFGKNLAAIVDLYYPRKHPFSQELRVSSAKFLMNFLHNDKKTSSFIVSNYISDADFAFSDLALYKFLLRFLYLSPRLSWCIVNLRKYLRLAFHK